MIGIDGPPVGVDVPSKAFCFRALDRRVVAILTNGLERAVKKLVTVAAMRRVMVSDRRRPGLPRLFARLAIGDPRQLFGAS